MDTPNSKRLYDKYFNFSSDRTRLEKALEEQKSKKEKLIERFRALQEDKSISNDSTCMINPDASLSQSMKSGNIKRLLMIPERVRMLPTDFDEWIVVIRPTGIRCLLITCSGVTRIYNDEGICMKKIHTYLPGGGIVRHGGPCIVDCIYSDVNHTFYIIDILSYNKQTLVGCSSEERFIFVNFKITDLCCDHELMRYCKNNNLPSFSDLSRFKISAPLQIMELVSSLHYEIDSFYIYHKKGMYFVNESSPLFLTISKDDFNNCFGIPSTQNEAQPNIPISMDID